MTIYTFLDKLKIFTVFRLNVTFKIKKYKLLVC